MKIKRISEKDYHQIFILSDIHGQFDLIKRVKEKVQLSKDDLLIIAGDSCDRGKKSKSVYNYILVLIDQGFNVIHLLGNHEDLMYNYLTYEDDFDLWMLNGGKETLASYKDDTKEMDQHIVFIENMPHIVELDNSIIVHAGLDSSKSLDLQVEKDILWKKNFNKELRVDMSKTVVIGHQITKSSRIEFNENRTISIDCGACKNGVLGILELKSGKEYYIYET